MHHPIAAATDGPDDGRVIRTFLIADVRGYTVWSSHRLDRTSVNVSHGRSGTPSIRHISGRYFFGPLRPLHQRRRRARSSTATSVVSLDSAGLIPCLGGCQDGDRSDAEGGCPVSCGGPSRSGITWIPRTFVAETVLYDRLVTPVERVSAVLAKYGVTGVLG
jgi:hypothetical protein